MTRVPTGLAAAAFLLAALYALGWESAPRPTGAFAQAAIGALTSRSALFVVQAREDRSAVLVGHDFDIRTNIAVAARIDLSNGTVTQVRVLRPFDRERFVVYDEVPLNAGALSTRFRGIRIPRPQLVLMNFLGDGTPRIAFDNALTGRERLVRTRGGETLLTRTLINGRDLERSRQATLSAYQAGGDAPLVCLYTTTRGTTAWLFHNDTPMTQEKP